jgi:phosphoglycerate kinase
MNARSKYSQMLTIRDLTKPQLEGKRVYVRVDFNVPQTNGVIRDTNRIQAALPTLRHLLKDGARVILMSHLGKIDWKEPDPTKIAAMKQANDMAPVAAVLQKFIPHNKVHFSPATSGPDLKTAVDALQNGEVLLVQNTRYEKGEEKNDPALAAEWASLADVFVMDAFGSAHRAHASTVGVPTLMKAQGKPVAEGYLMIREVENLTRCVRPTDQDRPYIAVLGGLKVSDKIKVIDTLLTKCDEILIGGAMAYTFQKALGIKVGNSPVEDDQLAYAKKCLDDAKGKIILPVDSIITNSFDPKPDRIIQTIKGDIPDGFEGVDIGPETAVLFKNEIAKAHLLFWNGPMGVFEQPEFQAGTKAICDGVRAIKGHAFTVCGGGDSASAVKEFGYMKDFSHVSTGGGASLEMIENDGHLPGVDVLL